MGKVSDRQKKQIIADYVICQNYREVGRKHCVSDMTVRRIVESDDSTLKRIEEKKEENTKDVLSFLNDKKTTACLAIDKLLAALTNDEKIEKASLAQIGTALGIVIDKFTKTGSDSSGGELGEALKKLWEIRKNDGNGIS